MHMFGKMALAVVLTAPLAIGVSGAVAAKSDVELKTVDWQHTGPIGSIAGILGTYDYEAVQRGFQVYQEVCSSCHAVKQLYYRNLSAIGLSEAEVKAVAAEATVIDGPNEEGEMFERPGKPADKIVKPFPNDEAARASNNGALPPDLSLIVKARGGHEGYIYSLLTGYAEPPDGVEMRDGMNYNPYFSSRQIAMAPPLEDDAVEYADGTKATADQMARDVVNFLAWASEPNLNDRKNMGLKVVLFLLLLSVVLYLAKRKVWSDQH